MVYSPVVISTFNELTGVVDWRNGCQRWFINIYYPPVRPELCQWNHSTYEITSGSSWTALSRIRPLVMQHEEELQHHRWQRFIQSMGKTTTCSNCKSSSSNILLALGVWFFSWSGSRTFAISQILLLAHLPQKEAFVEKQKGRICFSFFEFFLSTSGVSGLNAPSFIVCFFLTQLANSWTF